MGWMPRRVRKSGRFIRGLWESGVLTDPAELRNYWRDREDMRRVQRSLFYHRFATALLLARRLGLLTALADGPLTSEAAGKRCEILPEAAASLLRILESENVVRRSGDRYSLTEFGRRSLVESGPFSFADTLDLVAAQAAAFGEVEEALRTGATPPSLDIFEDNGATEAFLASVNRYLSWAARDLLRAADLPPIRSFIVGSMGVSFSAALLERHPSARVTYGCLEHLAREIPRLRREYEVPEGSVVGTHAHSGDPFADRWGDEAFDLVLLTKKMILNPEEEVGPRFAAKALEVLNPGGVAVLWETVHSDEGPSPLPIAMEAVMDLFASPATPVRTQRDYRQLLTDIGYARVEFVRVLGGQTSFVLAYKAAVA